MIREQPLLQMSIDDGCASDTRIAAIATRYKIPTVFYWPVEWKSLAYDNGYEPLTWEEAVDISKRFEIGSHTITHRHLTKISIAEACAEIADSRIQLQEMFDTEITKFCAPRGYTNKQLTDFTMKFYTSQRLTKGPGLVHIHPNSGANGNVPWRRYYETIAPTVDLVEFWGHSWEFDKYDLWYEIEDFFYDIRSK